METSLDHVVLAVADLAAATTAYSAMLGRAPSWHGTHPTFGTRNTLYRLDNTYLELLAPEVPGGFLADLVRAWLRDRAERPFALALGVPDVDGAVRELRELGVGATDPADGSGVDDASGRCRTWRSAFVDPETVRGLQLLLITHASPPDALPPAPPRAAAATVASAVDHVVVFTQDLEASVALWTERLGLRVAWRKDFPERGTRNVGLDLGGIVLELIQRTDREPRARGDALWGVAYRVAEVDAAAARLREAGFGASDARPGLAAGTRVANVRGDAWAAPRRLSSATPSGGALANVRWERTPTLLIAPA